MKFRSFPEQNLKLLGNGADVVDLDAWVNEENDHIVTCWEVMPLEKILILFFSKVYLRMDVPKERFPPVSLEVDNPFQPFTEPIGKVVGSLIDRKVQQFMNDMTTGDIYDLTDEATEKALQKILEGFAVWLLQDMTGFKNDA